MKRYILLSSICVLTASILIADADPSTDGEMPAQVVETPSEIPQNVKPPCERNDRSQRIIFKHREANGIGYPTGYSSVEGFFSTSKTPNLIGFADLQAHVFNDSKKAYNLGVGVRGLSEPVHLVFGANVFYDYRDGLHRAFNQIGVGLEVLGTRWDLRANGYIPVHNTKKKYSDGFLKFKGSSAIFAKRYEFAFVGCEVALGRELFRMRNWDLHAKLAGYWFNGEFGKNAGGGLFELATNITPYITLKGQASYDTLFRGVFQAEAAINVPFGWKFDDRESDLSCSVLKKLENRLIEAVDRFEIIVTSTKRKKAAALDPLTGQPLTFIFVDNTSHSLGTFESPYPTLLQAQNASDPNNVIYVFPGDGTNNGMSSGITLQNNQLLIGSGVPVTVTTAFGLRTIPAQTLTSPLISNTGSGGVVNLANNNTVKGFNMFSTAGAGIVGGSTTVGAFIANNSIVTNLNALSLPGLSGNVVIINNLLASTANNQNAVNLETAANFNLIMTGNSLLANSGDGTVLFVGDGTNGSLAFNFNTVNMDPPGPVTPVAAAKIGIDLVVGVGGLTPASVVGTISNNIVVNPSVQGITIGTTGGGSANLEISKNLIQNAGTTALFIETSNGAVSSSFVNVVSNIINNANSGMSSNVPGVEVATTGSGSLQLRLADNSSTSLNNSFGYLLTQSGSNTFSVETPNISNPQAGLQAINLGTFDPSSFTGSVTFIPFVP